MMTAHRHLFWSVAGWGACPLEPVHTPVRTGVLLHPPARSMQKVLD